MEYESKCPRKCTPNWSEKECNNRIGIKEIRPFFSRTRLMVPNTCNNLDAIDNCTRKKLYININTNY